jgi:hypothetical protein
VNIGEESSLHYQAAGIVQDHGSVTVKTQKRPPVHAEKTINPPEGDGNVQYAVMDGDGSVHIAARTGDLHLEYCGNRKELKQGDDYTCERKKGLRRSPRRASLAC